mgnify:CR=1 FL=1
MLFMYEFFLNQKGLQSQLSDLLQSFLVEHEN